MRAGIPPSLSVSSAGGSGEGVSGGGRSDISHSDAVGKNLPLPPLRTSEEALRYVRFINNVIWFARRRSAVWPPSAAEISDLAPLAASSDALAGCENWRTQASVLISISLLYSNPWLLSAQTCISYFLFRVRHRVSIKCTADLQDRIEVVSLILLKYQFLQSHYHAQ